MQQSIVRRSLIVTAAFVVGHLFHYALMFSANRILEPGAFGRFYAAISLLNVLLTPATVLSFMLARHFTEVFSTAGANALSSELTMLMRRHGSAGLVMVLIAAAALVFVGSLLGADALLLLLLVPATALAVYLFEMARAALQGMLHFYAYSAAWIVWRLAQYVVAVVALLLTRAAWSGLAGILVVTVFATAILLRTIYRRAAASGNDASGVTWAPLQVMASAPFGIQYGLFIVVNNIDVLLAYLVLSNDQLGSYSASSLLPKAIVTATLPVSQVMLPVMSATMPMQLGRLTALLKALAVSALLGTAGAAVLAFGGDLACNDRFGIRFCSPWLLNVLAIGAIPLCVTRVLVVAGLALQGERRVAIPAAVIIAFVVIVLIGASSAYALAVTYAGACWLFALVYGHTMLHGWQTASAAVSRTAADSKVPGAL